MARGRLGAPVSSDQLYTMRQLNQRTADVLREINETGRPALITRHGRFVAMIVPLANAGVEGAIAGKLLDEMELRGELLGEHTVEEAASSESVARELDLSLPSYPDRDAYEDDSSRRRAREERKRR
jgi:prevent-host-death family protein